ncbi:MAG: hypothetical protein ACK4Q5_18855 [Saprospiraceae bacterium]
MGEIHVSLKGQKINIEFNKADFNYEFWNRLFLRLQLEYISEKSQMTQAQAAELAEEAENDWWNREGKTWLQSLGAGA